MVSISIKVDIARKMHAQIIITNGFAYFIIIFGRTNLLLGPHRHSLNDFLYFFECKKKMKKRKKKNQKMRIKL